jgi:DNA-binding IclR family transcriptional regulator
MKAVSKASIVRLPDEDRVSPRSSADPEGRALRRGLAVLDAVRRAGDEGVRVVDLCRALQLQRATVHRVLDTLLDTGHLVRTARYRYGTAPTTSATRGPDGTPAEMARLLAPKLARISQACGDASFAVVREGHSAWCVARQVGTHPVQILAVQVGRRQPLGVGAAGLALLAALPEADAEAAMLAHDVMLSSYGGMTPERLRLLVRTTRERGWAAVGNHAARNAMGVGLAVHDTHGRAVAGVSVAAEMHRMTAQRQRWIVGLIRASLNAS